MQGVICVWYWHWLWLFAGFRRNGHQIVRVMISVFWIKFNTPISHPPPVPHIWQARLFILLVLSTLPSFTCVYSRFWLTCVHYTPLSDLIDSIIYPGCLEPYSSQINSRVYRYLISKTIVWFLKIVIPQKHINGQTPL